jgi:hypothetical protein
MWHSEGKEQDLWAGRCGGQNNFVSFDMHYIIMLGFGIRFRLVEITLHQTLLRLSI